MKPAMFERHADTQAVIDHLRATNDEVSYSELAARAGLTVDRCKQVLVSARRHLMSETIMFGTIRGHGLRRLSDSNKVQKSESNKKGLARSAGRAIKELDTVVHPELLNPREQLAITTNRLVFSSIKSQAKIRSSPGKEKATTSADVQPDAKAIIESKR